MPGTIYNRLHKRELGDQTRYSKLRGIYGDRTWVEGLDIVNELDGHTGCVNALSWSRSGRLLASGSDDTNVNIHSYLPELSTAQFNLTTTISTGHQANIFSVKFMPHSNDRTIVTAAGDCEVRIFDIEYAGRASIHSTAPLFQSSSRRRGLNNIYNGVRFLSDGDTNAKVFRSHSDRVKRIVTESSPYFFLTCSEDGEVRQWDLRQPSSAYPQPRGYPRWSSATGSADHVPPPLISYRRYHLDLNTISCSPSQPHYIALGGAHLHCFLHDRRMLGRDKPYERGLPASSPANWSDHDDEIMNQATCCVRKFAPRGQRKMKPHDNGHITACKISDANPNEMVVSWSSDYIYSFDLIRSPDAAAQSEDAISRSSKPLISSRVKESKSRKRKRTKAGSSVTQEGVERGGSRPRTDSPASGGGQHQMALMVQYENGQSEEIPIEPPETPIPAPEPQELYTEGERTSFRVAKMTVKLRKSMFVLGIPKAPSDMDPTGHATSFTSVLGFASSILPDMDEAMGTWRYPVHPSDLTITVQNTLREARGSARRFVQACGTLSRVLGGRLRTGGSSDSMIGEYFTTILPVVNERTLIPAYEQFAYDFLKAILLWLDSGVGALLEGFTHSSNLSRGSPRFPIAEDSSVEAIDEFLIPYLLRLASSQPIINVDVSRFEKDERLILFESEKAAVISFSHAVKVPFADLSSDIGASTSTDNTSSTLKEPVQDRHEALKFWAFKVGRGLLLNAGKAVDFSRTDRAFGGRGVPDASIKEEESNLRAKYETVNPNEEDVVVNATLVDRSQEQETGDVENETREGARTTATHNRVSTDSEEEIFQTRTSRPHISSLEEADEAESDEEELSSDDDDDDDADVDDPEEHDGNENSSESEEDQARVLFRSGYPRGGGLREKVEEYVPCSSHTRLYRGHCNVKTVKDVNFYGLQDEYVVSGSDCGHLFIWDKKTAQLVNILEGDGEVVNVVQGHPYEPMIAVSGIDHTVKIFSPDARARWNARNGIGVSAADASSFSSLELNRRRRVARSTSDRRTSETALFAQPQLSDPDSEDEAPAAPNGLSSKRRLNEEYQITSANNDAMRDRNRGAAFISRSVLNQLVAHLQEQMNAEDGGEGEGEGEGEDGDEGSLVTQLFPGGECRPM